MAGQNPKFQLRPENVAQFQFSKMAVNVSVSLCEGKKIKMNHLDKTNTHRT
jgi:hypothetical protein